MSWSVLEQVRAQDTCWYEGVSEVSAHACYRDKCFAYHGYVRQNAARVYTGMLLDGLTNTDLRVLWLYQGPLCSASCAIVMVSWQDSPLSLREMEPNVDQLACSLFQRGIVVSLVEVRVVLMQVEPYRTPDDVAKHLCTCLDFRRAADPLFLKFLGYFGRTPSSL